MGRAQTHDAHVSMANEKFSGVEAAFPGGGAGSEQIEDARMALIDAKAKRSNNDTNLHYLIGQSAPAASRGGISATGEAVSSLSAPLQIPKGAMAEKVRQALNNPATCDFTDTPLRDVMDYLADYHQVSTQVDKAHFEKDHPITISLKGVPLAAALQALEDENMPLNFVVRDYGLLATSRENAQQEGYFPAVEFARLGGGMMVVPIKPAEPPRPKKSSKNTKR